MATTEPAPPGGTAPSLLDGMATTRAIRRFHPEAFPDADLARMLFAATRAPSGSNAQPARFLVLRDGFRARRAREVLGHSFRQQWALQQRTMYGYDRAPEGSPAARLGPIPFS